MSVKRKSIVLVPGFASGAWIWTGQVEAFTYQLNVVAFDPRGIGATPVGDAGRLSIADFADDVAALLDRERIGSATVLGASFGGFVAQEFALRHAEMCERLILACTSAGGPAHVPPDPEILASFVPDPSMTVGERIRRFIRPAFTDEFLRQRPGRVEEVCRMREAVPVSDIVYQAQLRAAISFDSADRLKEIRCPTLVVTGDRDRVVPMENSLALAVAIPGARLAVIAGGSHMLMIENAAEFNRTVLDEIGAGQETDNIYAQR